jgi:predicted ribosomally synthesized peptide with nif11-like leader
MQDQARPCSARCLNHSTRREAMAHQQLKDFLALVQDDPALRQQVMAASTADDVAQIAASLGFQFSGDELLRASGQKIGRVTIAKQDMPGEYS